MKYCRALLLALALVASSISLTAAPANADLSRVPTTVVDVTARSGPVFEAQVMVEINVARMAAGRKPVRFFDSCVERMATRWGNRIARTGVFAHRDQRRVLNRCDQSWAGEDLIRGEDLDARSIVRAWLDSPAHRAVLLKRRANVAGVAVVLDGQGRQVGVLNLADSR